MLSKINLTTTGIPALLLFVLAVFVAAPFVAAPATATAGEVDLCAAADAVYEEVLDEYTWSSDGAMIHRRAHKVRALTHYALNRLLGESFLVYNPTFQKLEINLARTTMADGTQVDATPNAFNEVLPRICRNAPPFLHLREMVVTHLGLECQAVVHFDYQIRSKPGFYPFLMGEQTFGDRSPILKKSVVVHVPEGTKLVHRLFNHEGVEPKITSGNGQTTYRWTLTNLPLVAGERMGLPLGDAAPRLVFSTCGSWPQAGEALAERIGEAAVLDEVLEERLSAIRDKAAGPVVLMRELNELVASEVAHVAVPPEILGYRVRPAAATYATCVGTNFDCAVLLSALLRAAGLEAEPVLVSQHRDLAKNVPSWLQFQACRVLCFPGDNLSSAVLLDPAHVRGDLLEERLYGRTVLRPTTLGERLMALPARCAKGNTVVADLDLALDDKMRLTGTVRLSVSGALNPFLQLSEGFESWSKSRMQRLIPGADFTDLRAELLGEKRSVFSAKIDKPVPLAEEHGLFEYTLAACPGGVAEMRVPLDATERSTTLELPRAVTEELRLSLQLPKGAEIVAAPEGLEILGLPGSLKTKLDTTGDRCLRALRRLELCQTVDPEDYPALRQMLIEWSAPDQRRIVLRK